ncbi:hypothetical protein [Heyndrickxia sporothermodurans]|uniref:hypothetical protein n=1 Tax=Heyndrickxia sporothermodurans TaxID=46224 RepID=UPI00192B51CC|nr:hypothetical protein [Heyndrickxia sporothermodurans]MBL5805198.1 hypothetical protein [Heyndrickxia sporothermodurans]
MCLENGRLEIKVVLTKEARSYLERVIYYRTGQQTTQKREKEKRNRPFKSKEDIRQLSLINVS